MVARNAPEEAERKAALNKSLKAQVAAFEAAKGEGDLLRTDQLLAILETLRQEVRLSGEPRADDFDWHRDYPWIWRDIVEQYLPDLNRRIVSRELEEPGSTAAVKELRLVKTALQAAGGYQRRPDARDLEGDLRVVRTWLLLGVTSPATDEHPLLGEPQQETRGRDPNPGAAARRSIVRAHPKMKAEGLCKRFDLDDHVGFPSEWKEEFGVEDWESAYKHPELRKRIDSMVSKDKDLTRRGNLP